VFSLRTFFWLGLAVLQPVAVEWVAGQNASLSAQSPGSARAPASAPARNSVTFDGFVDAAVRQERRLTDLMRYYKPVAETYIQEYEFDSGRRPSAKSDDYFLSRLDLSGKSPINLRFVAPGRSNESGEKKLPKSPQTFAAEDFALALFPDQDHFDRPNYTFEFVRWEILGEVRCAVINVRPREKSQNLGFVGRIWVEDQDFNIVRFNGAYISKEFSKRPFHFDSWRQNTLSIIWMPAYVYTEDPEPPDLSSHGNWHKAQTRIWGYDLEHAGDHREFAKPLTDTPVWVDPNRHEASQDLSPAFTVGKTTYIPEDEVVERLQVAGLMAADGDVDHILETVVNNLLITNNLDLMGVRCRVLLTTPLESFVVGQTIVLSRGLLDVLPDEATLAAVMAHELAHIVLRHSQNPQYLLSFNLPFSDLEIFSKFNFRFDPALEADADKKGLELISKSPYKDKIANMALFLEAVEQHSPQLPNLLRGRFSNDFASSHLVGMPALSNSAKHLPVDQPDQVAALPLGSRIKVDPWSDRIEMLKNPAAPPPSALQKMVFEVSPFFPHLKRLEDH
jgi:hypothetical protein